MGIRKVLAVSDAVSSFRRLTTFTSEEGNLQLFSNTKNIGLLITTEHRNKKEQVCYFKILNANDKENA